VGIICFGLAILFILSFFRLAGPFGYFLYDTLYYLFGWVYFFLPIILVGAGIIFISSFRRHLYLSTIIGLLLITIGLLGISDLIKPLSAGLFGEGIGVLEQVLDLGRHCFCLVVLVVGLVVAFEWSIKLKSEELKTTEKMSKRAMPMEPVKDVTIKTGESEEKKMNLKRN